MVPTGTGKQGKPGKIGRHFPVGESQGILLRLEKSGKRQVILLKILENWKKLYWKMGKSTGNVGEICHLVIVKTLQIRYHTFNKKKNFKKSWKTAKSTGKVGELCQSEKVGTMTLLSLAQQRNLMISILDLTFEYNKTMPYYPLMSKVTESGLTLQQPNFKANSLCWQPQKRKVTTCRVPTAPGKPGKMVTVFPAWKNPGILSFLPNILEK